MRVLSIFSSNYKSSNCPGRRWDLVQNFSLSLTCQWGVTTISSDLLMLSQFQSLLEQSNLIKSVCACAFFKCNLVSNVCASIFLLCSVLCKFTTSVLVSVCVYLGLSSMHHQSVTKLKHTTLFHYWTRKTVCELKWHTCNEALCMFTLSQY